MSKTKSELATVEELAKICKVSIVTVDHYVDIGLLNVAARQGTTRLFNRSLCAGRIKEVHELLGRGMLLKEIKARITSGKKQVKKMLPLVNEKIKLIRENKILKNKVFIRFIVISCGMGAAFYLGKASTGTA